MKKIAKLIAVVSILTVLFTVPVMAREVSFSSDNTDYLIVLLNNNAAKMNNDLATFVKAQAGPGSEAIVANQTALVAAKIAQINKECAQNHLQMLQTKVYNAKQFEATRLAQLNNFKGLYATSATWAPQVAMAQAEYDKAVAARTAAEAYLAAAQAFGP